MVGEYVGVGRLIREARLRQGWSQAELSRRLGVEYRQIGAWESDQEPPSPSELEQLRQTIDLTPDELDELAGLLAGERVPQEDPLAEVAEVNDTAGFTKALQPDDTALVNETEPAAVGVAGYEPDGAPAATEESAAPAGPEESEEIVPPQPPQRNGSSPTQPQAVPAPAPPRATASEPEREAKHRSGVRRTKLFGWITGVLVVAGFGLIIVVSAAGLETTDEEEDHPLETTAGLILMGAIASGVTTFVLGTRARRLRRRGEAPPASRQPTVAPPRADGASGSSSGEPRLVTASGRLTPTGNNLWQVFGRSADLSLTVDGEPSGAVHSLWEGTSDFKGITGLRSTGVALDDGSELSIRAEQPGPKPAKPNFWGTVKEVRHARENRVVVVSESGERQVATVGPLDRPRSGRFWRAEAGGEVYDLVLSGSMSGRIRAEDRLIGHLERRRIANVISSKETEWTVDEPVPLAVILLFWHLLVGDWRAPSNGGGG